MNKIATLALIFIFSVSGAWASTGVVAKVDISTQTMTVYENGAVAYQWRVSTAGRGYRTPVGTYRPTRMHKMWYSRKYDNAPMPHSIFFTGGYAIHGTNHLKRLGTPASHGCVRLAPGHARTLYGLVQEHGARNTRIVVVR